MILSLIILILILMNMNLLKFGEKTNKQEGGLPRRLDTQEILEIKRILEEQRRDIKEIKDEIKDIKRRLSIREDISERIRRRAMDFLKYRG